MSSSPANAIAAAPQKHQCRLRLVSHRQKATRTKVDGFVEVHPKGLRWIDHERVSDLLKNHGRALAAWTHVERVSVEAADASFLKASKYKLVVSVAIPSSRGEGEPLHPDGDLPLRSPTTTALRESSTSSNSQNHVQTQRLKRFSYAFSGFENRRAFVMFLSGVRDAVRSHANAEEQSRILPGLLLPEVRSSVGRASESGGSGDGRLVEEGEKATKAEGDPENLDADLHDLGGSPLEATETSTHPAEVLSHPDRSASIMRAEWFALPEPAISGDRAELADGLFHNCSVSDFLNLFILVDCTHPLIKVPSKGGLPHANTVLLGDFFREEGFFGTGIGEGGGELLEDERLVGYDAAAELAKMKQESTTTNSTVPADRTRSWEKVPFWEKVRQQTFEKREGSFVLDESQAQRRKPRHSVCEIGRWEMPKRGERSPKYARNVRFDVDSPNPMGPRMTTMSEIVEFFVDEEQALHVTKASSAESVPFQESFRFDLHFLVKPDPRVWKAVLLTFTSLILQHLTSEMRALGVGAMAKHPSAL
eukprot:g15132.t1